MANLFETKCIIPDHVLYNANVLCGSHESRNGKIYLTNLECLSMVLEAFLLYEKVLTYDYIALTGPPDVDEKIGDLPIVEEFSNDKNPCITWIDPYEDLSSDDRVSLMLRMQRPFFHMVRGEDTGYTMVGKFYSEMRDTVDLKLSETRKVVKDSLGILGASNVLKEIIPSERNEFVREYFAKQLWRIDQLRTLSNQYKVSGSFLVPFWEPLWQHEREQMRSALHQKFRQSEDAMLKTHLASFSTINVSPLVIVALDRTKKPEQLPETICLMRKEFGELRSAGSKYAKLLDTAETYAEASDVVKEWGKAWESVLQRIYSHSVPYPQ